MAAGGGLPFSLCIAPASSYRADEGSVRSIRSVRSYYSDAAASMDRPLPGAEEEIPHLSVLLPEKRHCLRGAVLNLCKATLELSCIFVIDRVHIDGESWNPGRYLKHVRFGVVDADGGA